MQVKRSSNDGTNWPLVLNPLGGNVGIGTTNPSSALEIAATAGSGLFLNGPNGDSSNLRFRDATQSPSDFNIDYSAGRLRFFTETGLGTGGLVHMAITNGGNIGIGTTSPAQALDVNGSIRISGGNIVSGLRPNWVLSLQSDRNLCAYDNGSGVWCSGTSVSDIRLKRDIRPLEDVLPVVKNLSLIRFRYVEKMDDPNFHIGVIAQEIIKYYPEMVYYNQKTDNYIVYYDKLVTLALKAIQELTRTVEETVHDLKAFKSESREEIARLRAEHDAEINSLKSRAEQAESEALQLKAAICSIKDLPMCHP
jgi:hypothetical protein